MPPRLASDMTERQSNEFFDMQEMYRRMDAIGTRIGNLSEQVAVMKDRQVRIEDKLDEIDKDLKLTSTKINEIDVATKISTAKKIAVWGAFAAIGSFILWITSVGDKVLAMWGKR